MIKVTRQVCMASMRLGRNGTFIEGKNYWCRHSRFGTSILMLSEEKQWIRVMDSKMATGIQPISYFTSTDIFFVKDKKELNELIQN